MTPRHQPRHFKLRSRNNQFQHLQVLKNNREKRTRYKEFVVEGVRSINAACARGWAIVSFVYDPSNLHSDWAKTLLAENRAEQYLEVERSLFAELSDKDNPSEVLAVVRSAEDDLSRITLDQQSLIVVFDRPASPGNLGSSIRSCDALGATAVLITGHAADVYDPLCVRASTGSLFAVPIIRLDSAAQVLEWRANLLTKGHRLQLFGTDESGQTSVDHADLTGPSLIVFGNETHGLSKAFSSSCDLLLKIPMQGSASSLNISCATSIVLYECQRQRLKRALPSKHPPAEPGALNR
jgi:tRNA G18 (ribose-2'-O)-methylase SpoU